MVFLSEALANQLQKATITFVMSIRPPVRLPE
jgi:hypothetical protein